MSDFLTTRAQRWSDRMPEEPPRWIDRDDGFNVKFEEEEKLPLEWKRHLSHTGGHDVRVDEYRCTDVDEVVAIKSMDTRNDENIIATLKHEVEMLQRVSHYHSIRVLGSYTQPDVFGIVTQPAATCDLRGYLYDGGSSKTKALVRDFGPRSAALPRFMGCLAHGLQHIHSRKGEMASDGAQLRHRDIKPANILLKGRRVFFADFGISKAYTDTQTGTSGTSLKTQMYASPERVANSYRNTSCDIFSLGCVFAEIFTVYKGSSAQKFLDYRREKSTDREGNFHNTVSEVLQWLEDRAEERCDVQIVRLIRSMMRTNYEDRPSAEQVWKTLTTCTSGSLLYFCGPCCMPLICNDPLLDEDPDTDPSEAKYTLSKSGTIPNDLQFKEQYQAGKGPEVTWIRNLRHWPYATLDVVKSESLYPQARKRIFLNSGNQYGSDRAYNEAEILRQVKHRHIVALRSTYQHPGMLTLHYEPAADYDLRSFLGLVELRMTKLQDLSKDSQLQKDLHLLNESFGCLSAALSTVHQARYDHGEIRPANILVHDNRIFISKFSFGLKFGGSTTSSVYRYISPFGLIDLGNRGSRPSRDLLPPTLDPEVILYKPPEWTNEISEEGQPAADIFSLGCVFIEICRVLTGGRLGEFEEQRATSGRTAYRDTLPRTLELISTFENDTYETKDLFFDMLRRMIDEDPQKRPTAIEVHRTMAECMTREGHQRCGSCLLK